MASMYKSEEVFENVIKSLETWKKLILEVCENDEDRTNQLNILKNHVEGYCQLDKEYENTNKALQELDEQLNSDVKHEDVEKLYQECFDNVPTGFTNNYEQNRIWQAVFKGVKDIKEVRKKKKKLNDDDYEELDDSLLYSNVFAPPLDPISKIVVRNPYKSKKCGHVYEYDSITDYIKRMKAKAKCPYIGCRKDQLKMTDLVQDGALQTQITQYLESQNNEDSEEDD